MKLQYKILFFFLFILLFLFTPKPAFADCEMSEWDENTRNLTVCVGEFSSPAELRNTSVVFECTGNSNVPYGSFCRGITNDTYSFAGTPDDQIATDANGLYYTCITATNINRAIGSMDVNFYNDTTGELYCSIEGLYTRPGDWDVWDEGMPWQQGSNNPVRDGSIFCPDGRSMYTAIGCIPVDNADNFIQWVFRWSLGIAGGSTFILIIYGGFLLTTSSGDPNKAQEARSIIAAAISGLLFLIFSVFIYRIVGREILQIPGF